MRFDVVLAAFHLAANTPAVSAERLALVYRIDVEDGFYTTRRQSIAVAQAGLTTLRPFWLAERRARTTLGPNGATQTSSHQWIDGRSCPQLGAALATIEQIPTKLDAKKLPPFHGTRVRIAMPRLMDREFIRSDYEGPAANWWREAEPEIEACWQPVPIKIGEGAPPSLLDGDAPPIDPSKPGR